MLQRYRHSPGLSSPMLLLPLVLMLIASCSSSPLSLLTGGGPNVAANVQAGKTNSQTVGTTNNIAPTVSVRPNSRVETIDQRTSTTKFSSDRVGTLVVNEIPTWMILLFGVLCGFVIPSPPEIGRGLLKLFRRLD